jgi:hypothetical protein
MARKASKTDPAIPAPATPEMAERLAINRTGRLTPGQRRLVAITGVVALVLLLCPLAMLVQMGTLLLTNNIPALTVGLLVFGAVFLLFFIFLTGLIGTNAQIFLPDAFGKHPVRYARGPLQILPSSKNRPELPFSYIVEDYSFAPYVAPQDMTLIPGAPYLVYYSAHSRLLLSLAALDAPDASQWAPAFQNAPQKGKPSHD